MYAEPRPTGLPIEDVVDDVRRALEGGGTAIVTAEPGAGKSTVLPLRLLDASWLKGQRVVMLQPRRVAARATAARLASLLGEEVGRTVGYRIRGDRRVGRDTRLEVVTEGMLTRRLQHDPTLDGVGLVIFDEVHERNLQTDLALALTLDVRRGLRPDLRVLAMSATIDTGRLAGLLDDAAASVPIVSAAGRTHPVDIRWRPPTRERPIAAAVAAVVAEALRTEEGDVLVFLAGAGDIRRVERKLRGADLDVDIRPLFGALSSSEQDAALSPSPEGRRRVVLSTDIAETSLTVPGVRVVIDAGEARRPRYDGRSGLTRLETRRASRASADQRAGRAGRTEAGVAYRLWDAHDHARRDAFGEPEILAVDLSALMLELAVWGATAEELSFLDAPPKARRQEATVLLRRLDALDSEGRPTETGRAMADLPLHPRLAHMVVSCRGGPDAWTACVIAALLEERDVLRGRPEEVPADIVERVRRVTSDEGSGSPGRHDRSVVAARRSARDLARRSGVTPGPIDPSSCGAVLALAYPDRIAQARGGGRFRLRSGRGVVVSPNDALTGEGFLVVAELAESWTGPDDDRVRIAAALDRRDVERVGAGDIVDETEAVWDSSRHDVVVRTTRRLDAVVLSTSTTAPEPSAEVVDVLVDRVRAAGIGSLRWGKRSRSLQGQAGFARSHLGEDWPDVSDAALESSLGEWLPPLLTAARGRADLERVDMAAVLRGVLGHERVARLGGIAPESVALPSGRRIAIDYDTDPPSISVRAQEMYGTTRHPSIAEGRVPLAVHLLSPAGRPIQVTADLPGFWTGSWAEVRKDMAGRYPKHNWPADPANAEPTTRAQRNR